MHSAVFRQHVIADLQHICRRLVGFSGGVTALWLPAECLGAFLADLHQSSRLCWTVLRVVVHCVAVNLGGCKTLSNHCCTARCLGRLHCTV